MVGSFPFWASLISSNGFSVFQELTGSAVAVENDSFLKRLLTHLASFLLFGPSVIFGLVIFILAHLLSHPLPYALALH